MRIIVKSIKELPFSCQNCGRKIMVEKVVVSQTKNGLGYKMILRGKADYSQNKNKGNGKHHAKSYEDLKKLKKISVPI